MPIVVNGRPSLTISSGNSTSNTSVDFDVIAITIYAPATLTASQIQVEISPTTSAGSSFVTLQSGGEDVVVTAGKSVLISPPAFRQMRLISTATEDQEDIFRMTQAIHV